MKRLRGKLTFANAVLVAIAALLVAPGMAAAADSLYATPDPALGANCTAESPCGLATAMSTAVSGDTVVVGVGTYEPAGTYEDGGRSLTIEGAVVGIGRPVVDGNFVLTGPATRISDVEIYSTGFESPLAIGGGAEADRVVSISANIGDGCRIDSSGAVISNSLCVTNSTFFSGLSTQSTSGSGPVAIQHVTMIGDKGFYSHASGDITVSDSIAMRNSSAGEDGSLGSETTNFVRSYLLHSSGTALTNEEPLEEEPIFRGPADYREAAGSPSIDFGSATAEPDELDLDGNLRKIGAKTDIGAFEFVPDAPSVSSPSATSITESSATVGATINPNSGRTYYHLEYGSNSAYGSSTPVVPMSAATTGSAVQVALSELAAGSTVHYSLVATSDGGTTRTPDATFTTVSPATSAPEAKVSNPAPPVSPTPAPTAKLAPMLTFKGGKRGKPKGQPLLDRSAIKLSTGCGPIACGVTVRGTVKVGSQSFGSLPGPKTPSHWQAGKQGAMKLRVSSKIQSRVRAYLEADPAARAKILVTATYVTAAGEKATRKLTIPVRPL